MLNFCHLTLYGVIGFIGSGSFLTFGPQYSGNMFWFYIWINCCFIGAFLTFRIYTYDRVSEFSTFKVNVSRKIHRLFELYPSEGNESHEWICFLVAITHHKGKKKTDMKKIHLQVYYHVRIVWTLLEVIYLKKNGASSAAQMVKNLPAVQETQVWSLYWEDLLEKGMAAHSSILAWRIPLTEELGGLQSMGSQRVRHNWMTNTYSLT